MVDPLSVLGAILTAVQLMGSAASTASQNKCKCVELAERTKNLADILPSLAHAAAYHAGTARVLERLRDAVGEALRLIQSCQSGGIFSGKYGSGKAAELDSVDKRINNCIMDLTLISQVHGTVNKVTAAGPAPAQTFVQAQADHHSTYYHHQAQEGASWHARGVPQLQGYYQQPPGYAHWAASPAPYYAAPQAPSGSNLSSLYTLPTVNKIFNRVFR